MSALLAAVGLPRLWRSDEDVLWRYLRAYAAPIVMRLAPSWAYGADRIPAEGGLILAANHFSGIDHPVLSALSPRPLAFAAKAELFSVPILGEALLWTGAFPVHRGTPDRAALRRGRERAEDGHVVAVHLEGTRMRSGRPGEFKGGGILMAMQAGVPVVPCGLDTFGWSLRNRRPCAAVFGEPIDLGRLATNRRGYREGTEIVGAEIVRLWDQAVEARRAGFPLELGDGARRTGPTRPSRCG
jgi:1-acyl-sn-glycerol-3-phosphate acyltransferase